MSRATRSSERAAIAPFRAMEMAREADRRIAAGERIVRFDVGQPFVGAPDTARAAIRAQIDTHLFGYTDGLGAPALRARIAAWYGETYGLDVAPARVAITAGASAAFVLTFLALFNTGDRVALAAPGYPPYRHVLKALGMNPAMIEAQPREKLQLTPAHLRTLALEAPLAGALVASPANPTGAMLNKAELAALADAARAEGAAFISDEIYHGLTYEAPAVTALAVDPDAIIINSFSKYWAMTGWRIGWIVAPEPLMGAIERLSQNLFISAPAPGQAAALAAIEAREACEARKAVYAANRARILSALPGLGLKAVAPPDGAFYVLVDIGAHGMDSETFAARALAEAGVSMTAGIDFDETRGRDWVRIAYARAEDEVVEGLERLAGWLR